MRCWRRRRIRHRAARGAPRHRSLVHLRQQHRDVLLLAQDPADRRRDVAGRQRRGRHLIEQRLEQVVVVAIEQRDPDRRAGERARRVEAAESAADDDDAWSASSHASTGASGSHWTLLRLRSCYRDSMYSPGPIVASREPPLGGPVVDRRDRLPARLPRRLQPRRHRAARQGRHHRRIAQEPGHRRLHLREGAAVRRARLRARSAALSGGPQRAARATGKFKRVSWDEALEPDRRSDASRRRREVGRRIDPAVLVRRLERPADAGQPRRARCGGGSAPRGWRARSARRRPARPTWRSTARCRRSPTRTIPEAAADRPVGRQPVGVRHPPRARTCARRRSAAPSSSSIDPRTTPLARSADVHLAVRPGTDVAVALAIHRYLFENGYADEAFLRRAHAAAPTGCASAPSAWTIERAAERRRHRSPRRSSASPSCTRRARRR